MKRKKIIVAVGCVAAAVVIGGIGWFLFGKGKSGKDDNVVYVNTVEKLMDLGSGSGLTNRYSGVVEAQDTWSLQQNSEKTVKDVLVQVGQEVRVGEALFTYDTDKYQTDLEQGQLDLERLNNEYSSMNDTMTQLQKDLKAADKDSKNAIQLQIQEASLQQKQKEYEIKSKQVELDKLNKNIGEATVYSEIDGVVKSINQGTQTDGSSTDNSFITILATGDYRIKGKINEMNMGSLTEGTAVIVHSRTDSTKTWKGTVSKIDRENASASGSQSGAFGYGSSDASQATTSSNYPFYVSLENSQDLMLGQHVYLEPDFGQEEVVKKTGVWLQNYYINDIDSDPYVWADNGSGKLEMRKVVLGQSDDTMGMREIADGLTKEDKITFPEDGLKEGMKTEVSLDGMLGQSNPDISMDGMEDTTNPDAAGMEDMTGTDAAGMEDTTGTDAAGMEDSTGMDESSGTDAAQAAGTVDGEGA